MLAQPSVLKELENSLRLYVVVVLCLFGSVFVSIVIKTLRHHFIALIQNSKCNNTFNTEEITDVFFLLVCLFYPKKQYHRGCWFNR